jgi:hypothetical protein
MSINQNVSKIANKRWRMYLEEEKENNRTFVDKNKYLVSIILSIIKMILWLRGNIQSKKRRIIIERVYVE